MVLLRLVVQSKVDWRVIVYYGICTKESHVKTWCL